MLFEIPNSMTDEMLARGIKVMLIDGQFTTDDFELLPASVYLAIAKSIRLVEDNGELHGATTQKIIKTSMIEAILDAEYPEEAKPL